MRFERQSFHLIFNLSNLDRRLGEDTCFSLLNSPSAFKLIARGKQSRCIRNPIWAAWYHAKRSKEQTSSGKGFDDLPETDQLSTTLPSGDSGVYPIHAAPTPSSRVPLYTMVASVNDTPADLPVVAIPQRPPNL